MAEPHLEIVEQPKSRGYRFRYECEGSSHGNITGATSSKGHRTFPTVKLVNWPSHARISVQCVTDEEKPKPHTHELIGKNCKDGICVIELKPSDNYIAKFDGLSIKHSTRKRAIEILTLRNQEAILQEKKQKSLNCGHELGDDLQLTAAEKQRAQKEAKLISPKLDLSVVRLLFKANLLTSPSGPVFKTLEVVSNPIYDAKSPGAAALRICRMDKSSGSCVGDEEIFLLCDKVQKDDIAVCFEEYDTDGVLKWVAYGKFGPQDVHRQFAIVFRTPPYRTTKIDSPVQVQVKLKRLNKPEESNGVLFTYHPEQQDEDQIKHKRKKKLNYNLLERFPNHGSNDIHSMCPAPANGMVTGNGNLKRNNMQQVYTHPAVTSNLQSTTQNQSLADDHHNGAMFPLTTTLPSMTAPNMVHMMPSPQAPSPASSYVLSPKQSPSPQSIYDQSMDYYQPIEYDLPIYEQMSPYQGRGLSDKGSHPYVKPTPTRQLYNEFLNQPVAVLDLSNPKPLDLAVSKIKTDSASSYEPSIKATIENSDVMNNVKNVSKTTENCNTLQTKPCNTESQLAKQVIAFGDRLFKALLKYAQTADTSFLLMVLRQLMTEQDENGDNVLHLAVIHNKLDALRKLLKVARTLTDCDVVNKTNNRGQTPLHLATILRDLNLVEVLLCYNASITLVDNCGNSPIHLAVIHKAPECLKLMLACLVQENKGKSPEVNKLNYKGLAPLHLAVQSGHIDCIKALVEVGKANINIEDGCSGKTPLHYAMEKDQLAIVGYLINQSYIDVNAPDFSGFTPLHIAVMSRLHGCAALLMAVGADPDAEIIEKVADSDDESCSESDVDRDELNSEKERQKNKEDEKDVTQADGESEEEDESPADTVIITAWTLAEGDDTMQSILRCEECTDPGHTMESMRIHEFLHKVSSKDDNHLYTAPPGSDELDIMELDPLVRKQLADLLDPVQPEKDWKALAQKLHMLPSLIEVFSYMSSPTKALLDNYESTEGSLEKLRTALIEMKRLDATKLIDEVKNQKKIARSVHGKTGSRSMPFDLARVESGIESMTFGI